MTYAADPAALQAAVAAGILGCGSVVLGTAEACGRFLIQARARTAGGADARRSRWRRSGRRAARCRASGIRCTSRSIRGRSASWRWPRSGAPPAPHVALARAAEAVVPRGLGQAAADERLDADRGGAARSRLPAGDPEGHPDPRAHRLAARASRRGERAARSASSWRRRPRRRSPTTPTRAPDARPRRRDPALGGAGGAPTTRPIARRSPISSSARRSTATSSPRRASADAASVGGLAAIAALPLTEKDELRASRTAASTRSARISPRRWPRSCASIRPAAPPARRAISRSPARTSRPGSRSPRRSYAASGVAAGQRLVSTYGAGPFVAARGARRLRGARPLPHPGRAREHREAAGRGRRRWRPTPSR